MNPRNIPAQMRAVDQWVVWGLTKKENGRLDKVPIDPVTGKAVSAHDPRNWMPFDQAVEFLKDMEDDVDEHGVRPGGGVGLSLTKEISIFCVDLDGCIVDGQLSELASLTLDRLEGCYVEYSPSLTGLHVWGIGKWNGQRKRGEVRSGTVTGAWEVYDSKQFLTVTSVVYDPTLAPPPETPVTGTSGGQNRPFAGDLPNVQEALDGLAAEWSPRESGRDGSGDGVGTVDCDPEGASWTLEQGVVIDRLCKHNDKFRKTWHRKRRDKGMSDQSASSYCMAIADALVEAGFDDQWICDALVYWRTKEEEDLKLGRNDNWYARTIAAARSGRHEEGRVKEEEERLEDDDASHEEKFDGVNGLLKACEVVSIVRYPTDPPTYEMLVKPASGRFKDEIRTVNLGGPDWYDESTGQKLFRREVIDASGVRVPKLTSTQWELLSRRLIDLVVDVDIAGGTNADVVIAALQSYLLRYQPTEKDSDVLRHRQPVFYEGSSAFFVQDLQRFCRRSEIKLPRRIYPTLKGLDFTPKTFKVGDSSTQYWVIPDRLWATVRPPDEVPPL